MTAARSFARDRYFRAALLAFALSLIGRLCAEDVAGVTPFRNDSPGEAVESIVMYHVVLAPPFIVLAWIAHSLRHPSKPDGGPT